MPRNLFERELQKLNNTITEMGHRVDVIMQETIDVLKTQDIEKAEAVTHEDAEINAMEHDIEQMCMRLIALQQPIAHDLRTITSTLKMITDIERVSDQCTDICEIFATFPTDSSMKVPPKILQMFEKARGMFTGALDAFIRHDKESAKKICLEDDNVDSLFSKTVLELCGIIPENQLVIPQAVDYMFIGKYIERIADHATNIAEWAIFLETGVHPDLNNDKNPLSREK